MATPVADTYSVASGATITAGIVTQFSPTTLTLSDVWTGYSGAQPILQRYQLEDYGNLPVLFSYTGSDPNGIQARVIKSVGGTTVVDWTDLDNLTASSGTGEGYLNGVPLGDGYKVQIRDGWNPANGSTISNGATVWGCGVKFAFWGQSNMLQTIGTSYTLVVPGTAVSELTYWGSHPVHGSVIDNAGTHGPTAGSAGAPGSIITALGNICAFMRIVAAGLYAKYGYHVPVGIIPWAFSSTSITLYKNGGTHWNTLVNNSGTNAATKNIGFSSPKNYMMQDFEGFFWHQGEADQAAMSSATYQGHLQTLNSNLLTHVAQFGRTAATFNFNPAVLGNYGTANCPSIENIRAAVGNYETWAAANSLPKSRIGWTTIDLDTASGGGAGLHFVGVSDMQKSMRRCIQTALFNLGASANGPSGSPFSGRGPTINMTPSRNSLVVTLSVVHEGGASLQVPTPASAPTGFYANTLADFTGTDITPTVALINSNTQIELTFPGGTSFPVYVKYMGGKIGSTVTDGQGYTASCHPNYTNAIYDNVSYPSQWY